MKARGKCRFRQPAFSRSEEEVGGTAMDGIQSTSFASLVLAAVLALGAGGLGCGRQQAKPTSSKGATPGESAANRSGQQANPLGLAGTSAGRTTPNPTREPPLDLRKVLASTSVQQARKTREEVEDFRRNNIKGLSWRFPAIRAPALSPPMPCCCRPRQMCWASPPTEFPGPTW